MVSKVKFPVFLFPFWSSRRSQVTEDDLAAVKIGVQNRNCLERKI
jgi:hypothetical protein